MCVCVFSYSTENLLGMHDVYMQKFFLLQIEAAIWLS